MSNIDIIFIIFNVFENLLKNNYYFVALKISTLIAIRIKNNGCGKFTKNCEYATAVNIKSFPKKLNYLWTINLVLLTAPDSSLNTNQYEPFDKVKLFREIVLIPTAVLKF